MKSAIAITYELDDNSVALSELVTQIREKLDIGKNSVGILYGQPDMDIGELSGMLNKEFGFSIIGGTTGCGASLSSDGYHELAVILHVMTADDCAFSASISRPLTEHPQSGIVEAYNDALSNLQAQDSEDGIPKMVFCVTPLLQNYSTDTCFDALSETSDGLPIFGFVAADDFEFSKQQVYLDNVCSGNSIALLIISGNVKPLFEVRNLAGSQTLSKRHVTKAHDNIICEIDGKPACEYLKEFPFIDRKSTRLNSSH